MMDVLFDKLPDSLSAESKAYRIDNMLKSLKKEKKINNETHGPHSIWFLVKDK